jgi:predicted enzyme related to lactoylglutathione lyase
MISTPSIRWTTITIDCSDAEALGAFYSQLFGWEITARDGVGWLQLHNRQGAIGLNIQAEDADEAPIWPEQPGHQAKMMHFELLVTDLDAAVQRVIECGGREAPHQPADRDRTRLRVMLDPAGHPFCLFVDGE